MSTKFGSAPKSILSSEYCGLVLWNELVVSSRLVSPHLASSHIYSQPRDHPTNYNDIQWTHSYKHINNSEPQVTILGGPDATLRLGDPMNLTCIITQSPDQFQFIFWFKDGKVINFDLDPNRAKIVISKEPNKPDITTSNLLIFSSTLTDSANYTCQPSGVQSTSIFVHVLRGKSAIRKLHFPLIGFHNVPP